MFAFDHVLAIATTYDATVHILNVADTTHDGVVNLQGDSADSLEEKGEQTVSEAADRAQQRESIASQK